MFSNIWLDLWPEERQYKTIESILKVPSPPPLPPNTSQVLLKYIRTQRNNIFPKNVAEKEYDSARAHNCCSLIFWVVYMFFSVDISKLLMRDYTCLLLSCLLFNTSVMKSFLPHIYICNLSNHTINAKEIP